MFALMLQKLRMPKMHDVEGSGSVGRIRHHRPPPWLRWERRLSRSVNNRAIMAWFLDFTETDFQEKQAVAARGLFTDSYRPLAPLFMERRGLVRRTEIEAVV